MIYNLLNEIFILLDDGDRHLLSQFNLSIPRYYVLVHLGNEPGLSLSRLSELMICDKSNATRIIRGMETEGLVRRKRHESDGRTYRLYLTEKGETLRQKATQAHDAYTVERLTCCQTINLDTLKKGLIEIRDNLKVSLETLKQRTSN